MRSRRSSAALMLLSLAIVLYGPQPGAAASQLGARLSAPLGRATLAAPGDKLWSKRYNGPGKDDDFANAVGTSPDGSTVFVTGQSTGLAGNYDFATFAYDAGTGAKLWSKRYNGPGNRDDDATALGVSPDGTKVFVTGASYGSTGLLDYATVAYDASTGTKLWAKRYAGPGGGNDQPFALGVSPDGSTVFVTGTSFGSTFDYATVAYVAATGKQLWIERYDGPAMRTDHALALGVSPDGARVYVTGRSQGSGSTFDYATVAYDASNGTEEWAVRYNGPGNGDDQPYALEVSPDGSKVFVTGTSYTSTVLYFDYATVAYDASGNQLWAMSYNGPQSGYDYALALGVDPDGSAVFVTGQSGNAALGAWDYATVAYGISDGTQLWAKIYDGPSNADDLATDLAVSPDGSAVFVTGNSEGQNATLAYQASDGTKMWVARSKLPTASSGIGVSPDGSKVFVTGSTYDPLTSHYDYATVAYSAI